MWNKALLLVGWGLALLLGAGGLRAEEVSGPGDAPRYADKDAAWWVEELRHADRQPAVMVALRVIGPPSLPALIDALDDPDPRYRERLWLTLRQLPGGKEALLPHLGPALDDPAHPVVNHALTLLRELGPAAQPFVGEIARRVERGGWPHAQGAIHVLGTLGPEAAEAFPALIAVVERGDASLSVAALHALARIDPDAEAAVAAARRFLDAKPAFGVQVLPALGGFEPDVPGLFETVASAAHEGNEAVRRVALQVLGGWARTDPRVAPLLVAGARDPAWMVAEAALRGLHHAPDRAAEILDVLLDYVRGEDAHRREVSFQLLAQLAATEAGREVLGPSIPLFGAYLGRNRSAPAVLAHLLPESASVLVEGFGSDDGARRLAAYEGLRNASADDLAGHGADLAQAARVFFEAPTAQPQARVTAVDLLARVAPASPEVFALLLALADHPDAGVRSRLPHALAQVPASLPALLEMLGSTSVAERNLAWGVVTRGSRRGDHTERMAELLDHAAPDVRWRAAEWILSRHYNPPVGGDALVAVLGEWLASADPSRVQRALQFLHGIGAPAAATREAVEGLLGHADAAVALQAAHVLARLESLRSTLSLDSLVSALDSDDGLRASGAALALAHMGVDAEALVPALRRLLDDPDVRVRRRALQAAERLGPAARPLCDVLVRLARDPDGVDRASVVRLLGQAGTDDDAAFEVLLSVLADRDEPACAVVPAALAAFGPRGRDALIGALDDDDPRVLTGAVAALASMGEARRVVERLEVLRAHPEERVRQSVENALARVADER